MKNEKITFVQKIKNFLTKIKTAIKNSKQTDFHITHSR